MAYRHGIYVEEVPTSVLAPANVSAGLPVVFGTAPVNMTDNPSENVNKPILALSYSEAVEALGFVPADDDGKFEYSLCEFMRSHFALFTVAPVVFVNVLDPASHTQSVVDEALSLSDGSVALTDTGAVTDTIVVKSDDGQTTYDAGDDYEITFNSDGYAVINRLEDGTIPSDDTALTVDYDHLDTTAVDASDIIGGVDGTTGEQTGLELIDQVFPRFRRVPGQILAPGYSQDPTVSAAMTAKATNINEHFRAIALTDVPTTEITNYTGVAEWKNDNNYTSEDQAVCWPKVALEGEQFHLSSQLAGRICLTDSENEDIPFRSPSNQNLQMNSAVLEDGSEIILGPNQAALLNGEGVTTALNFVGGWKAWGNRTGAYPASSDPKDSFLAIRRMFNWVGNTLTLTFWERLDFPLNRRQIQTVTDSANIWLNGLVAREFLLGGRVEFLEDENPTTDLLDGIARFHIHLTPPSPNREIDFVLEYDPSYLQGLFE